MLAPSSVPPRSARARAQASTIRAREGFVLERGGPGAAKRFAEAASPRLRAMLAATDPPDGWIDFELFVEANVIADRVLGRGDLLLAREIGRWAAAHNAGVWRSLFERGVAVPTFVGIAAGLWHKHYDSGSLHNEVLGADTVRMEIRGFATPHRTHCLSVAGWVEGVFDFDPRTVVRVSEGPCRSLGDATCAMTLTWAAKDR